jgi:hypothetical protein
VVFRVDAVVDVMELYYRRKPAKEEIYANAWSIETRFPRDQNAKRNPKGCTSGSVCWSEHSVQHCRRFEVTNMSNKIRLAALLILLLAPPLVRAATLKPETKAAWDVYLQAATEAMQARLQPGANFLWLDDEPDRAEHARTKGPTSGRSVSTFPKRFHSALSTIGLARGSFLT